uniref:Reverse transcriptase domain-containing protein n=1 Tax=Tanacetum cinerariifolium TaxID=118510 RepID=A0A6L2K1T1_TANCI|nr:hypothetical protein [Tanacetum cinerariifolium]
MKYHSLDKRLIDLIMMNLMRQTEECDMMLHIEKSDMLMLVAEIEVGDKTADDVDKLACAADVVKLRNRVTIRTIVCQPIDQNIDSSGSDKIQTPHYPVIHRPSQEMSEEVFQAKGDLMKSIRTFLEKFNQELSEYINSPSLNYPTFYDNDEEHYVQYIEYLEKSSDAITPILPTEEPEYSISMGYEHLSTTPATELDAVTESSAKNLLPIPSEYEVTSDDESKYDVPVKDDSSLAFTTFSNPLFDDNDDFTSSDDELLPDEDVLTEEFKVYSNPLFDDGEINSDEIDPHCFNAESNLIESLLNRDTLIDSSPKFDFLLNEFSDELGRINPILTEIKEADFDLEEEICFVEKLLYDNSSPRPPKELNAEIADTIVESLSPYPIPVEDSDSLMDEIDLFLATDDLLPPRIESDAMIRKEISIFLRNYL